MNKIKRIIRLCAVWIIKILFGKKHFKVSFIKRLYFAINGGFMADQVVLYDLNNKKKNDYLSEFDWYKSRYINGSYGRVLDNKVVCSDLLKEYVKVPNVFYIKKDEFIFSYDGKECSYDRVINSLKKAGKLFIKPISAGKGKGVNRLSYDNDMFYIDEKEISFDDLILFLKNRKSWFICENIKQSSFLDKIYDKTSNTMRIISVRDKNSNKCEVINAVLRIGTKETIPVDNGSRGGLVCKIDIESGKLSSAKSIQKICDFEKHPDSGSVIEGKIIPNWDKIKKEIVSLMEKLPYIYFIAWDVLLTDDGMCIIEANSSSGVNIVQMWGGQRNEKLGEFYRTHNIIR